MTFNCRNVWPRYSSASEERWRLNGSLNYYTILQLELFCERAGEMMRFLTCKHLRCYIRKRKSQTVATLWYEGLKRNPREKSVLPEDKEGNESEDILLQTLNPPLAMLAVPASALTILMQLMSIPSIASCFYTPAPDTEVQEVPSYRINWKILCWFLGHNDMVWYGHLRPNWALSLAPEPPPGQGNFPLSCREPQWEWPANWVFEDAQSIFNLRFV